MQIKHATPTKFEVAQGKKDYLWIEINQAAGGVNLSVETETLVSAPHKNLPLPALSVPFITTFPTPPALTEAAFSGTMMETVISNRVGTSQLPQKVPDLLLSHSACAPIYCTPWRFLIPGSGPAWQGTRTDNLGSRGLLQSHKLSTACPELKAEDPALL